MNQIEYLDAAKQAMGITSDNELAKRLEANRGTISAIREGKRGVPVEMAFRLAITLNQDPATVLADLEAQREKNPKRAAFWRSFLKRAALVVLIACTLASNFIGTSATEAATLGGMLAGSAAVFYAVWVRIIWVYVSFRLSICENRL